MVQPRPKNEIAVLKKRGAKVHANGSEVSSAAQTRTASSVHAARGRRRILQTRNTLSVFLANVLAKRVDVPGDAMSSG